jgi:hypothetical protein
MFYCHAHPIDETLGTPARTHISWASSSST